MSTWTWQHWKRQEREEPGVVGLRDVAGPAQLRDAKAGLFEAPTTKDTQNESMF